MIKAQWLLGLLLSGSFAIEVNAQQHQLGIHGGGTDFTWREYLLNNDDVKREALIEEGTLGAFGLDYAYTDKGSKFKADFTFSSGSIDYFGEINGGTAGERFSSTTDYDLYTIELEYGAWFEMDYIKPYAAVFGGYEQKNRLINPLRSPGGGLDEKFTHWYFGALLEAEIFSWNGLSMDVGGNISRTVRGENDVIGFTVSAEGARTDDYQGTVELRAVYALNLYGRIHYDFLSTWRASFVIESGFADMDKSKPTNIPFKLKGTTFNRTIDQPEVEQETTYIGFRLQKAF
ncbi:hypothetical protein [Marinagarivorans algicola]|uniref:hypothetical protein n=1 Tax=Marinagarivorans algicola TaxID=1513270 RepID=UPI003735944C